jgi:hypothetical protein
MRVNVYAEEITNKVELVETVAEHTGARFLGLRFFLKTHEDMLPPRHPDDDSSAVTFWIKSGDYGYRKGNEHRLRMILLYALRLLQSLGAGEGETP